MLYEILKEHMNTNAKEVEAFKLYLATVLINAPTKVEKYQPSIYFDNPDIKDIEYRGLTIPFYIDKKNDTLVILGIFIA